MMKHLRPCLAVVAIVWSLFAWPQQPETIVRPRPRIALVLGGGGAKGAAEVGVLKVMEELDVQPDLIVGTSIGSIVGALYAMGYRAASLDSLFRSQEWVELFTKGNLCGYFEKLTGLEDEQNFDSLPIPFACVAVDIRNQREVVLRRGRLPQAMRASMAIPGVFKPVKIDGLTLVDGGMLNNLPVDVARQMGADIVVAVDLTQNRHPTRDFSLKSLTGIGGVLDWLVSRPDWKKLNENRQDADIYINPQLGKFGAMDFNHDDIADMMAIGEEAARAHSEELQALSGR